VSREPAYLTSAAMDVAAQANPSEPEPGGQSCSARHVRCVLQRNVKLGNVRDRMFAAMVRPMLERTKRTIRAEDVQGVKELRKLGPLLRVATGLQACRSTELELCRYGGTERDRAGNRKRVHGSVLRADLACALQPFWMGRSSRRSGVGVATASWPVRGSLLPVATGLQACRSTELELCRSMGGEGVPLPLSRRS
jgi:hypothetical protein